jgi:hypothetical protein
VSRLTYDDPTVLRIKVNHPIVAIKRPEERDLQLRVGLSIDDFGFSFGDFLLAIRLSARVHDFYVAVFEAGVNGRHIAIAVSFETVGVFCDLKPAANVSREIDVGNSGKVRRLAIAERVCTGHRTEKKQ